MLYHMMALVADTLLSIPIIGLQHTTISLLPPNPTEAAIHTNKTTLGFNVPAGLRCYVDSSS
jgi:hypothetical protein